MNYQDFICSCIGIPADICKLLDKIEDKFDMWEYFDIEEDFIKELIKCCIDDRGIKAGNMLILNLYNEIIDHYIQEYSEEYPDFQENLFKTWVDGYTSELWFAGMKVESKKQLNQKIKKWIKITHKNQ